MAFILPEDLQLWAQFDTQVVNSRHLCDDEALLLASNALLAGLSTYSLKHKLQTPIVMAETLQTRDPILRSLQQVTAVIQRTSKPTPAKGRPLKAKYNFDDIILASAGDRFTDPTGWLPMVLWTVAYASERGTHDFKSARARVIWLAAEHLRNSSELAVSEIQALVHAATTHNSIHWPNGYEFFQALFDKTDTMFRAQHANISAAQLLEVLELMDKCSFKHLSLVEICTTLWIRGVEEANDTVWRDQVHRMVNVLIKSGYHEQATLVFKCVICHCCHHGSWCLRWLFRFCFAVSTLTHACSWQPNIGRCSLANLTFPSGELTGSRLIEISPALRSDGSRARVGAATARTI